MYKIYLLIYTMLYYIPSDIYSRIQIIHEMYPILICAGTPKPNITIAKSSLNNLSISWSVSSVEYVTKYMVYWSGPFTEIGTKARNATVYANYTIHSLRSNTPYQVTIEAIGTLGRQNSTSQQIYTSPTG